MPSWAMEGTVTTTTTSNNKEHAYPIERNSENTPEVKDLIEKRRIFAKNNPKSRALIKFSYFCANCRAPEYFGVDNCFTCKFFEGDMSLMDKRKVRPPSNKFTYDIRK